MGLIYNLYVCWTWTANKFHVRRTFDRRFGNITWRILVLAFMGICIMAVTAWEYVLVWIALVLFVFAFLLIALVDTKRQHKCLSFWQKYNKASSLIRTRRAVIHQALRDTVGLEKCYFGAFQYDHYSKKALSGAHWLCLHVGYRVAPTVLFAIRFAKFAFQDSSISETPVMVDPEWHHSNDHVSNIHKNNSLTSSKKMIRKACMEHDPSVI